MNNCLNTSATSVRLGDYNTLLEMRDTARTEEFEDFASILLTLKTAPTWDGAKNEPDLDDEGDSWSASNGSLYFNKKTLQNGQQNDEEDKKHSDQEDFLEEEDDEWMENPVRPWSKTIGGIKKKAPSGTACEKHKRWKKRCPETCPMREPKYHKKPEEQQSDVSLGDLEWDDDDIMRFVGVIRDATRVSKLGSQVNKVLNRIEDILLSSKGITRPRNHGEYVGIVRWSLNQLKNEDVTQPALELIERASIQLDFHHGIALGDHAEDSDKLDYDEEEDQFDGEEDCEDAEASWTNVRGKSHLDRFMRSTNSAGAETSWTASRKRERNAANRFRKSSVKLSTIACEYHTSLHARCPPNCPERRPARVHPRTKRAKTSGDELTDMQEELSPQTHEEDERRQAITGSPPVVTRAGRVVKLSSADSNNENLPDITQNLPPHSESSNLPTSQTKSQSQRRYLPQACERHRMMHARCPANCPDRIRRDGEESPQQSPISNFQLAN